MHSPTALSVKIPLSGVIAAKRNHDVIVVTSLHRFLQQQQHRSFHCTINDQIPCSKGTSLDVDPVYEPGHRFMSVISKLRNSVRDKWPKEQNGSKTNLFSTTLSPFDGAPEGD